MDELDKPIQVLRRYLDKVSISYLKGKGRYSLFRSADQSSTRICSIFLQITPPTLRYPYTHLQLEEHAANTQAPAFRLDKAMST